MLSNDAGVLVILGPTCTGKSRLALDLAEEFGGEIVNADSMQVYRHFDIGTAKPSMEEQKGIPHHLIDIAEPFEEFNAARFKETADEAVTEIWTLGNIPVLVGGTGLYIKALLYDLFKVPTDPALRTNLKESYTSDPLAMYEELKGMDPTYALRISHRDRIRVVRAIEVFRLTGTPMSQWVKAHGFKEARYRALKIGLTGDRNELYGRIDLRVDDMFARGWIDEVRAILARGYREDLKPFSSIGYKEILLYLRDLISFDDMVKRVKQETRHYAKRQLTWFSKEKDVSWYDYPQDLASIKTNVAAFLTGWT